MSSKNVVFKFEDMNNKDKASKAVLRYFKAAGASVVQVNVSPNIKRTSGVSYRELILTFADSQTVIFRVKQTGDIYQVLLNGRVIALANQDDHVLSISEIVKKMDVGRTAFQKKLARTKITIPKGLKSSVPKTLNTLVEKRDALIAAIAEAEQELQVLQE